MTKLTDTQIQILTMAAETEGGLMDVSAANKSAVAGLIKRGFAMLVPQAYGPSRLLLTAAGRQSLGLDEPTAPKAEEVLANPMAAPTDPALVKTRGRKIATKPEAATEVTVKPKGKLATLVGLLERPQGATIDSMMEATGWQAHSVRGAMSGSLKKALGLIITSGKVDGVRVYRVAAGAAA